MGVGRCGGDVSPVPDLVRMLEDRTQTPLQAMDARHHSPVGESRRGRLREVLQRGLISVRHAIIGDSLLYGPHAHEAFDNVAFLE